MKRIITTFVLVCLISGTLLMDSCKKDKTLATLTTNAITNITIRTATSGGVITKDGGDAVTARGVCWGIAQNPTVAGFHTTDDKGTGSFTSNITDLSANTLYYVRAYATNGVGTAYGNEVSFTTSPVVVATLTTTTVTAITLTTAVSGGDITSDGGANITAKGVCWATAANPTISNSFTSDGTGTGSFVSNLSGLLPGTPYYLRAYATNSAGTTYGNEVSFITNPVVVPTLTTTAVSSITLTTAISGGNISADGGAAITARGVCWAITTAPTISNSILADAAPGIGSYISSLSALTPGTTYYVRAYATNSAGTAYGAEQTFITSPVGVPALTTTVATGITLTSAVSGGNITSDGGGAVTARGVCWATATGPTILSSKTSDATGSGSFTSNLTGLLPATIYYVRAYATNSAGTAYGNEQTFTTSQIVAPALTTTAVTAVGLTTAVSGGNVTSDGGGTITARGVCWAITSAPTTSNTILADAAPGTGVFTSNMTGLLPATRYYVRAYATNSIGTTYGNEQSFTTSQVVAPTLTTTAVTSITLTTAISGGNITDNGGGAVNARGVCWATTTGPTILSSKTSDATGSGIFISNLSALLPGTIYYIRAYAINSAGTAYGNELTFTTGAIVAPTVTTTAITAITGSTATSGGNVTADGGATVSERGVCWGTTTSPTTLNFITTNGPGTGIFASNLTLLLPGTTYFVRAYATNSAGTGYGPELTFATTASVPIITTTAVTAITSSAAASGGNITSDGGAAVTARGVCWATTTAPTTANNPTSNGTGPGVFTSNLTGLLPGTTYYLRAYATNSIGTGYGNEQVFRTTNLTGTVTDVEGTVYPTVRIGNLWWMAQNLRTTHYRNNSPITNITNSTVWSTLTTEAYCWYNNDGTTYRPLYGAMYNWFAVTNSASPLCPTGWHVPSDLEFQALETALAMDPAVLSVWGWRGTDQGDQMKSTSGWPVGQNGTNTSGFNALPGGYRYAVTGSFNNVGELSYWWTSTQEEVVTTTAWYRRLDGIIDPPVTGTFHHNVYRAAVTKTGGKYVRCVQ